MIRVIGSLTESRIKLFEGLKVQVPPFSIHQQFPPKMASVYKSLSKSSGHKEKAGDGEAKHKQRVLILSSRGVTMR